MNLPTNDSVVNRKMFVRSWRVRRNTHHLRYLGHAVKASMSSAGYFIDGVFFPEDVFKLPVAEMTEAVECGITRARRMAVRS